jgi:hypothetical protein
LNFAPSLIKRFLKAGALPAPPGRIWAESEVAPKANPLLQRLSALPINRNSRLLFIGVYVFP